MEGAGERQAWAGWMSWLPIKVSGDPCTGLAHRHFRRVGAGVDIRPGFMHQSINYHRLSPSTCHIIVLDLIYSSLRLHRLCRNDISIILTSVLGTLVRAETVILCTYAEGPLPVVDSPICTGCTVCAFFLARLFVSIALLFLCHRLTARLINRSIRSTQWKNYSPSLFTFFPAHHFTPVSPETNPPHQRHPCSPVTSPATHLSDHTSRLRLRVESQQIPHTAFATLSPHWLRRLTRVSSLHSLPQHHDTRSLSLSLTAPSVV
jgi:hypothetical protein